MCVCVCVCVCVCKLCVCVCVCVCARTCVNVSIMCVRTCVAYISTSPSHYCPAVQCVSSALYKREHTKGGAKRGVERERKKNTHPNLSWLYHWLALRVCQSASAAQSICNSYHKVFTPNPASRENYDNGPEAFLWLCLTGGKRAVYYSRQSNSIQYSFGA